MAKVSGDDVVYVERESEARGGSSPLWWLLIGGAIGAGIALLLAPQTGEDTRQGLVSRARRLKQLTEEKLRRYAADEEAEDVAGASGAWEDEEDEEVEEEDDEEVEEVEEEGAAPVRTSARVSAARKELERRLARSRTRREALADVAVRRDEDPDEEPVA